MGGDRPHLGRPGGAYVELLRRRMTGDLRCQERQARVKGFLVCFFSSFCGGLGFDRPAAQKVTGRGGSESPLRPKVQRQNR
jgi:hypothetical protein